MTSSNSILSQLCMGLTLKRKRPTAENTDNKTKKEVEVCTNTKDLHPGKLQGKPEKVQNRLRTHYGIGVWGDDLPALITDFGALQSRYGVSAQLLANVAACGYSKPTPVQMAVIPAMMERREILACAPTGSGKTASFLIPMIHLLGAPKTDGFRAIIVSPTRELAKQTYREAMKLAEGTGLRIYVLSKASNAQRRFSLETAASLDIMVTTPNRLVWLLKETDLSLAKVQHFVIDESDRLFEAAKTGGFREQLESIYAACCSSKGHQLRRALFSATSSKDLDKWCRLHLDAAVAVAVGAKNSVTRQVEQKLVFVGTEHGKLFELKQLLREGVKPPVLIFVEKKAATERLSEALALDGRRVDCLHAGRTDSERDRVIDNFRMGRIDILVCSELAGRGIDFKGVQLVVNYDFPQSAPAYIHRVGRTGRAGCTGRAITFFTENDAPKLREIVQVVRKAGCEVPDYMLKLNAKRLKNLATARLSRKLKLKAGDAKAAAAKKKDASAPAGNDDALMKVKVKKSANGKRLKRLQTGKSKMGSSKLNKIVNKKKKKPTDSEE